jgi:hypothetical protein
MEYIFGQNNDIEVLKTKGSEHSNLLGFHEIESKYPDQTITDSFRVVKKIDSQEDVGGNCYDWYEIDHHYRYTDKFTAGNEKIQAQIESITPYKETKTAYIGDTDVTFYTDVTGNLTVYFPYEYTVERLTDRIIITFEPLEEVTDITISIL